jgi:hypothetical protein
MIWLAADRVAAVQTVQLIFVVSVTSVVREGVLDRGVTPRQAGCWSTSRYLRHP